MVDISQLPLDPPGTPPIGNERIPALRGFVQGVSEGEGIALTPAQIVLLGLTPGSAQTTIVTEGGTTTLVVSQYAAAVIIVSGALTANAIIVVPNNGVWIVANRSSGAWSVTVTTSGGSGVAIDQGTAAQLVADGTNVVFADTDFNGITLRGAVTNAGTISGGFIAGGFAQLSAAGTNQGTATPIATQVAAFTTVASGAGGVLPAAAVGVGGEVFNDGANALLLYPNGSDAINGGAAGAAAPIMAGGYARWFKRASGQVDVR